MSENAMTERCKSCYYSSANREGYEVGYMTCDYCVIMSRSRGCPVGDDCDKYKPGKRSKEPNILFGTKKRGDKK